MLVLYPAAEPVIRPGLYSNVVPVIENSMTAPLVIVSRRRMKETSQDVSPGLVVDDGRMFEIRTGLPVSVERTSLYTRFLCPSKWSGGCAGEVIFTVSPQS